ncbi:MAG: hypothetical protein NW200_11710 [Hyphomonadaceae bacterium]|nr:hypothetical protein [Hyphomonadaceae bacterium]
MAMMSGADLLARAHLPLAALVIVAGIGVAAASRDLLKRLLGAGAAMLASGAHLAAIAPAAEAGLAAGLLALAAIGLGLVALVRIREAFGDVDGRRILAGLEDDAVSADRDA